MKPDRAWVLLGSGKRLNLVDPQPDSWSDRDLAIGLSRVYRWVGHSRWELPLSVAQHSLLVLMLRQQMTPDWPLSRQEALRELLHDGAEGLLGFDAVLPIKPHLGRDFEALDARLQAAITRRYGLPTWAQDDYRLHKQADRLAAASEAFHVAGRSLQDMVDSLKLDTAPVAVDPLPAFAGLPPWEPWPPRLSASLFLAKLRELTDPNTDLPAASLVVIVERERTIRSLATSFLRLPLDQRCGCRAPPTGCSLFDSFVSGESDCSLESAGGIVADGRRDDDGQ